MLRADLQRWRGVKAKEIGKPAYVVFDNKTLDLIVEAKPRNLAALGRVKGVGPKNEDALNELGIYTFKQIAEWTPENVDWVEDFMSFPGRIEREDWIAQAKTLAEGGETEFSKRVDAGDVPSSQEDED